MHLFKVKNTYEQVFKGKYFKEKNILKKKHYLHSIIKFSFLLPPPHIFIALNHYVKFTLYSVLFKKLTYL